MAIIPNNAANEKGEAAGIDVNEVLEGELAADALLQDVPEFGGIRGRVNRRLNAAVCRQPLP